MFGIFLAEGFEEIEALTVYDILKRANLDVKLIGVGSRQVKAAHGLKVETDINIDDINNDDMEMIILPGGMPGTNNLRSSKKLKELLDYQYMNNKRIAAICAAPIILGELGFLENKKAVCFPGFEDKLTGAIITKDVVVTQQNITTSMGPGTAHLFAFEIVRLTCGNVVKKRLMEQMQYDSKDCIEKMLER